MGGGGGAGPEADVLWGPRIFQVFVVCCCCVFFGGEWRRSLMVTRVQLPRAAWSLQKAWGGHGFGLRFGTGHEKLVWGSRFPFCGGACDKGEAFVLTLKRQGLGSKTKLQTTTWSRCIANQPRRSPDPASCCRYICCATTFPKTETHMPSELSSGLPSVPTLATRPVTSIPWPSRLAVGQK